MMFSPLFRGSFLVREFVMDDLPAFTTYRQDPEVARYQSWSSYSYEEALALYERMKQVPFGTPGHWFQLAICDDDDEALLGDLALHFIDEQQVEVGFTISREHQGKGVASAALRALLGFLFGELSKHRVVATIDAENHSAARLLERVGFRKEGHFIDNVFFKGAWGSECLYALLASEWREKAKP